MQMHYLWFSAGLDVCVGLSCIAEPTLLQRPHIIVTSKWKCVVAPPLELCEGDGDVVGVVTPLRGGAQVVLHGIQVVEVGVRLREKWKKTEKDRSK